MLPVISCLLNWLIHIWVATEKRIGEGKHVLDVVRYPRVPAALGKRAPLLSLSTCTCTVDTDFTNRSIQY